jgi:hypothetical protein
MRAMILFGAVAVMSCGPSSSRGPGLPVCSRPAGSSGCVTQWSGTLNGSGICSQTVTSGTSGQGWTLFVNGGGGTSTVEIGIALQSAPSAGSSWSMQQMVSSDAKLTDTSSPAGWEATGSQGDFVLQVDSIVQGSGNVHGTFSGSLVPNPGAAEPGIQLCVFL